MKIAIFIDEDFNFTFDALKRLIPRLKNEHTLKGIIFFPHKLVKFKGIHIYLAYLGIFGIPVFVKLAWRAVLKRLIACSFGRMCRHYGVETIDAKNPNDRSVISWLKENDIDVVLNFVGYILKNNVLEAPRICTLNKHAGLLPAYKGVFPVFWALMKGDRVGVTIHKMDENIDGGEIVLQEICVLSREGAERSVYDYYRIIFDRIPDLFMESLQLISSNQQKKCEHGMPSSYFGMPTRKDYIEFKKQGYRFV